MTSRLFHIVKLFANPLKLLLFARLVASAYRYPGKSAHRLIKSVGRKWCGIEPCGESVSAWCCWFMDCIFQAQADVFKAKVSPALDLGAAGIGVDGLRIRCSAENANSSTVYLLGFDSNVTQFEVYRLFALPGTAAIDVGANLGIHSLVLSTFVGGGGKVFAFEPVPSIRAMMEENLRINHITNVEVNEYALGNSTGEVSFEENAGDFNIGKGRVNREGRLSVTINTIDHALRDIKLPVSIIKIDTEGYELEVLQGAVGLLKNHRPAIVAEFNAQSYTLSKLKQYIPKGYSCFEFPKCSRRGFRLVQEDLPHSCELLIVPDEKLS
jgi:FkbM family methyltransferase